MNTTNNIGGNNMAIWSNKHKDRAAEAVIATRDFCGDEFAAVKQYADDNGLKFPKAQYNNIIYRADKLWRLSQKAAGVNPKYYK